MNRQPIIEGNDILKLIPQRPPIVMVDKFFGIDHVSSFTGLSVKEDNIFFDRNHFSEPGLIEHIAQSAAARIGYLFKQQNEPIPIGFIGSVDKMKIHMLPSAGDELLTEIKIIQEVEAITLIEAMVKVKDQIVAECRMKIFLKKG